MYILIIIIMSYNNYIIIFLTELISMSYLVHIAINNSKTMYIQVIIEANHRKSFIFNSEYDYIL